MGRLIVYTCVTGSYDSLRDPVAVCPDADYVCFTANPVTSGVWQWRPLPSVQKDAALTSRWPKINPHELFPDYDYSLWIDANVVITGPAFYERLFSLMDSGVLYAGIRHPFRDDVYEESVRVVANSRETLPRMMRAVSLLVAEGFPRHAGLMENNVILRRHSDPRVVRFDTLWWSFIKEHTYRDQISQGRCLRATALPCALLLPPGITARNCPDLLYIPHSSSLLTDRSLRGRWNVYRADVKRIVYRLWLSFKMRSLEKGR